jgi:MFS family permease
MDDLLRDPIKLAALSALLGAILLAIAGVLALVRRLRPPTPVAVMEDWFRLEQRRFRNPGALPRGLATLVLAIALVGGAVAGPLALGVRFENHVRGWGIAVTVAIVLSIVGWAVLRPKRPRCPACKSLELDKDLSLPRGRGSIRVYLCRRCQVVWQTGYTVGEFGRLDLPNNHF